MKPEARMVAQADMAARYAWVRGATTRLAERLSPEDCALQSMPDASPVKWHLAHTTWFFETFVLDRFAAGYRALDPNYRFLFNSYYHAVGEQFPRPQRGMLSRPSLDEVWAYRRTVDQQVKAVLEGRAIPLEAMKLIELGLHHEQQHQELIVTDLKHLFSLNPLSPSLFPGSEYQGEILEDLYWLKMPGGEKEFGHDGAGFAFDNERPRHRQIVEAFELASRPVTNGEFLAFIEDGGYRRPELWLADGWAAVQAQGWSAPLYWRKAPAGWNVYTTSGSGALEMSAPVTHVSQFEADAYARWASARLPTEYEWEFAAGELPGTGRVWEWTSSSYAPYPGYRPAPGAVGEYNGKFMSNQYVLRGGSVATPESHVRPTYRNFFPSSARWQYSGVRLARDAV